MRKDIVLEDTTLRDGEQTPGVAFSLATKTAILDALIDLGVRWIEVGIPVMGGTELEFVRSTLERQDECRMVAWHRGVRADVEQSLAMGFRAIHIGLPTSEVHLATSVRKDRRWLLDTATSLIAQAKDRDAFVSISAEDMARSEIGFLQEYAGVVHEAGADRLRLSDTIGIMTPEQYGEKIQAVRSACDIDLQCHTHNDFGLALANTLAGLAAGARYFHATVNGIGERAGMTDLGQAAATLQLRYGVDLGLDLAGLTALSRLVAGATGIDLPPWQPITGDNAFAHESGIHTNGMLRDASSFEPFPPNLVGGTRRYVLGKHSGRAVVAWTLRQHGITPLDGLLQPCLDEVRARSIELGGEVPATDLLEIYRRLSG